MKYCHFLMEKLTEQSSLYQPGNFWKEASKDLVEEFSEHGIENFRRLNSPLSFFVPTYGFPGNACSKPIMNSFKQWQIEQNLPEKQESFFTQFSSGFSSALADYRVLAASEYADQDIPRLLEFSESEVGNPIEHFEIEGKLYSRSALNYLLGLAFLKKFIDFSTIETVMEIGGGFGTLGEIVYKTLPGSQYINIDIPPTICCSSYYLQQVCGDQNVTTFENLKSRDKIKVQDLTSVTVLPSWQIELLQGKVDLFINFISFQEMEPEIVQNYLDHVSRLKTKWVLLRNMREGKPLRSQHRFGVDKPIFSEDYQVMLSGYELVAKNVIPFGFKTVDGFHSELMLFQRK